MTEKKYTAGNTLAEIIQDPKNQEILAQNHVPCLSCPMAGLEMPTLTLGQVCEMYGLELDKILEQLNS